MTTTAIEPLRGVAWVVTPGSGPFPIGTLLYHDFTVRHPDPVAAAEAQGRNPWCPACIRVEPGAERAAVEFVHAAATLPGVILQASGCLPTVQAITAAVDRRPPPTADALVSYIVRRLDCHDAYDALRDAVAPGATDGSVRIPPRTLRRRVHGLGRYRPWEWQRLARLARLLDRGAAPLDRLASEADTEARTLRCWTRKLLGVSLAAYRRWHGWECVLEAGLRMGGYVDAFGGRIGVSPAASVGLAGVEIGAAAAGPLRDSWGGTAATASEAAPPASPPACR